MRQSTSKMELTFPRLKQPVSLKLSSTMLWFQFSTFGGSLDGQNFVVPYMGTYYFISNNYLKLDGPTLKEYIRNQMWVLLIIQVSVFLFDFPCSEYYFSEDNLNRDFFLRRKMNSEGYLPVTLIASFHRVQALTSNIALIADAISPSDKIELSAGIKIWYDDDKSTDSFILNYL